ncbi:MAG: ArsR/SmtB family transcription factor [Desulfovibrionaceae bacterium]
MNELAEGFKALADPTRLRLLNLLCAGELCVCDLMESLELPQSKVSRHLSYLKKEKWVAGRRKGKWMYYRLATPRQPILVDVLETLKQHLGSYDLSQQDIARLRRYLQVKATTHCG